MSEAQRKATAAIGEAAAEWVVRLASAEVSAADKAEFMNWLRDSPQHVSEYLQAETVFLALQGVAREDGSDVAQLLESARGNVVELSSEREEAMTSEGTPPSSLPTPRPDSKSGRRRYAWLSGAAAAIALAIAGLALLRPFAGSDSTVYATGTGEQRHIVLADGSAMDLNTRSAVQVEFGEGVRDVRLLRGEAFFDVAKDPTRPFRVRSGTAIVRAIGTQFNVYRKATQTVVTVVEGRVAVTSGAADVVAQNSSGGTSSAGALELSAGQEVAVASHRASRATAAHLVAADARAATAWRQRRLIFENETLADVIAQFNRYNRRQLVIRDAQLAGERISGVFDADKPQDLLDFLMRNGEVEESSSHEARIALAPRD